LSQQSTEHPPNRPRSTLKTTHDRSDDLPMPTHPHRDYEHETRLARSPFRRRLWMAAGHVCVGLAVLGIPLPLLPTTPFLLLAGVCYGRGSIRFYNWLMNHRWLGAPIRRWRETRTVSLSAKITITAMVALTISPTVYFVIPFVAVQIIMVLVAVVALTVLWRQPSSVPTPTIGLADAEIS
jgi:uncharacterized membrane protein YbaN (DUF454 family)